MKELKLDLKKNKSEIIKEMGDELDKIHVGGDKFQSSRILDQVNDVHRYISAMINRALGSGGSGSDAKIYDGDVFIVGGDETPDFSTGKSIVSPPTIFRIN